MVLDVRNLVHVKLCLSLTPPLAEEYGELFYLIIATFFWGVFLPICVKIQGCRFVQAQLLTCNYKHLCLCW